ncbi:MAG: OmpA family protein [Candidatus Cyclobacteriaceae bacterium M2_1C_046]
MRRSSLFFILLFFYSVLKGQDPTQLATEYLQQADLIYAEQKEAIEIAKELYILAAEIDTNHLRANWMAGLLFIETINKDQALPYFLRVKRIKSSFRFDIDYYIGRAYHYGLDFEKALEYYEAYKRKYMANGTYRGKDKVPIGVVERRIRESKNGMEIVGRPSRYSIHALGNEINSEWPDYAPVISEDETLLIFTSRRQEGNMSADVDRDNFYFEDIFYSEKVNGEWTKAKNIGAPINTTYHDANISLSFNEKRLYLYKDENRGDLYYSDFINGQWTEPERMSSRINSTTFAERSITETSDPDVIIYSSDRPGGVGGMDLYMVSKDEKGNWYKTKSLGPKINTKYDEDSPFLLHDGKTLFFSSSGQKGYGGFDIFKSVYDSTKREWGEPENLGYPVNTPDDEIYFTATRDGKKAYYASIREEGKGHTDIFLIKLHDEAREYNFKPEPQITASVEDEPVTRKPQLSEAIFNSVESIYFDVDNYTIRKDFLPLMDSIMNLADQYREIVIDISGYSSIDGNPRYNIELSQKRALAVKDFLINNGVREDQIIARGFGSSDHYEEKEMNRRADIKLLYRGRKSDIQP